MVEKSGESAPRKMTGFPVASSKGQEQIVLRSFPGFPLAEVQFVVPWFIGLVHCFGFIAWFLVPWLSFVCVFWASLWPR